MALDNAEKLEALNNLLLKILKNEKYTINYHIKAFKKVVEELEGYSENIVISFIDLYKNTLKNNDKYLHIQNFTSEDYERIGINFSKLAKEHGFKVFTCGERNNLMKFGFDKGSCLTKEFATKLLNKVGKSAKFKKQTNRKDNSTCECIQTVDIGLTILVNLFVDIATQILMKIKLRKTLFCIVMILHYLLVKLKVVTL